MMQDFTDFDFDHDFDEIEDQDQPIINVDRRAAGAPAVQLDPVQQGALEHARQHRYTDISGTAGVGKTEVAKALARDRGVKLAATTGIAAVNLGEGTTINALLRYFNTDSLKEAYLRQHVQSTIRRLRRIGVERIVLDEKSMLNGQQLTYLARALEEVNEGKVEKLERVGADDDTGWGENEDDPSPVRGAQKDLPPIGLTLVGDFGQLPPVPDQDPLTLKKLPVLFAFDSPEWGAFARHRTVLEKIYRQDALDFVRALHHVRKAQVQPAMDFFTAEKFSPTTDDSFPGTTIFATNLEVDRYNLLRMDGLKGAPMVSETVRGGKPRGDWKLIPDQLALKEGALVMILANRRVYDSPEDQEGRLIYANGDLGTLVGADGIGWGVQLQRTGQVVRVLRIRREHTVALEPGRKKEIVQAITNGLLPGTIADYITEDGKGKEEIIGTVDYMPLRAAYGCTVHKTQGLTLDSVQVNLRDHFFKNPGMLFVALSRARTADKLRVVGDQRGFVERCRLEPRVQPWL